MSVEVQATRADAGPAPELVAFDHLEWWVGNARQSAHFFAAGFGFDITAYAGPETGVRDRESYVLEQGDLRFVVTNSLEPDSEIAEFVRRHGDGVRDVAYLVDDAGETFDRVVARGAQALTDPSRANDATGSVLRAAIRSYGDTVHSLIERRDYHGVFLPGYQPSDLALAGGDPVGLDRFDHVVANVEQGTLDDWVAWYAEVWGFDRLQHFGRDAISTEYSALRSTVVWNGGRVVQPVNEAAPGLRQSQIAEFLDYYRGPGVQHIAMHTDDIVAAVRALRGRGIRFLRVPGTYYQEAHERLAGLGVDLPWEALAELGILVDCDENGHLLQIFTENVAGRPTSFLEIIQREGARGFGEGNFRALFQAIEAEQAKRGNL